MGRAAGREGASEVRPIPSFTTTAAVASATSGLPDPDANGIVQYLGDDPDLISSSEKCDELMRAGGGRK